MNWFETGRFLIIVGAVVLAIGMVFLMADRIPLGRLPGDISLGSGRIRVYIPIATCILLSVVLTLVLNFFSRK